MNVEANIQEYLHGDGQSQGVKPTERYASFDYCFNYFQSFKEQKRLGALVSPEHMQMSCLQLGFYLASWGMFRGKAFLLRKSIKFYESVLRMVAATDPALWDIDANCYTDGNIKLLLELKKAIVNALGRAHGPSDILVSKIMLGIFGTVPAFDTYFKIGFDVSTFGPRSLEKVAGFYQAHQALIERYRTPTLDFASGQPTGCIREQR